VSARSVKVINEKTTERDIWWKRLRNEIEKNAKSLNCNLILGYREVINIYENFVIMSVTGTACKLEKKNKNYM